MDGLPAGNREMRGIQWPEIGEKGVGGRGGIGTFAHFRAGSNSLLTYSDIGENWINLEKTIPNYFFRHTIRGIRRR
jgi:hypothetical protein